MRKKTIAIASIMMLTLGACGAMGDKMMAKKQPAGIGASECFAAGGTIDNTSGSAMCKMKDGAMKPII